MFNRYLTFYKPSLQFIVFCAIASICMLIGYQVFALLIDHFTGYSIAAVAEIKVPEPHLADQLKKFNAISIAVLYLIPALAFAYLAYPKPDEYLGLNISFKTHHVLWAITLLLISLPFTSLLEEWSRHIPALGNSKELDEQYNQQMMAMLHGKRSIDLLSNIFFMCIAPAIIEELFFRGAMQQVLLNWMRLTPFAAILIVAVCFSAFHGQLSGFIPRVYLGLLLGLTYYYSGSIYLTMIMHFLNNFITVYLFYLYRSGLSSLDLMKLPDMNLILGIGSGIASIGLVYMFYKDRKPFQIFEVEKEEITQ